MAMMKLFIASLLLVGTNAFELTPTNVDDAVAGKTVFIKFLAPWWGHCKSMKPAWDALMAEHKDSKSILVADVDCTAAGKPLCDAAGVKGYPTIKYGDYGDLQDYKGGRDEKALKAFTKTLKPSCSPSNIDLCDAAKKKDIETFIKMDDKDLDKMIAEKEKLNTDAEETFKTEVEKLQKTYEGLQKAKEAKLEEVKESGLGLMKAVVAHKKKNGGKAEL